MSGTADSLAGGSKLETHSDPGTSSSPYHNPSPPSGSFIVFKRDMSDDDDSSGSEDDSVSETPKGPSAKNIRKRAELIRMVHRYLNKEVDETHQFSEKTTYLLARIVRNARYDYRLSAKKRLQHLEWAAKTLTAAAFTPYVRLFGIDGQLKRLLSYLDPKGKHVEEKPTEAAILKSLEKLSEQKKFQKLRKLAGGMSEESEEERDAFNRWALTLLDEVWRPKFEHVIKTQPRKIKNRELMSRPLSEVPFNATERKLVEGLLSLLMRTSEFVAHRPWPQISQTEHRDKAKVKQVRKILRELKRDERLLDRLRGCLDLGWRNRVKTLSVGRLAAPKFKIHSTTCMPLFVFFSP
jgi:hypothetical protein